MRYNTCPFGAPFIRSANPNLLSKCFPQLVKFFKPCFILGAFGSEFLTSDGIGVDFLEGHLVVDRSIPVLQAADLVFSLFQVIFPFSLFCLLFLLFLPAKL